jgi:uncharacterized membrane protein YbhN (UPF0104 family)
MNAAPAGFRLRKNAGFIFRLLASAFMIWLVFRRLDWASVGTILGHADRRLLAVASALTILPVFLLAARWHIFIRQQGISVSGKSVFFLTWAGQFFNTVLPGNTGGDFVKIFHLCRIAPDSKAGAVASVVIDRLTALAALLALAACSLVRQPMPDLPPGWSLPAWPPVAAAGLALLAAGAGIFLWNRLPVRARLAGFFDAMKLGARPGLPLGAGFALSFVIHLISFFHFFLFCRALGFSITYADTLVFLPVLMVLMMLPVTVNGHGLRELVLICYFHALHIVPASASGTGAAEAVVSLSILMVANELLWSLPGGIIYMARLRGIR